MSTLEVPAARLNALGGEVRKIPAFVRRDFLVAWSYRMSFVSDMVNMTGQIVVFYFIGLMIDPTVLPTYGGSEVTYLEFAAVGIAVGVFIQFGLNRVSAAMRGEQLMGTLESVLVTPTAPTTIQLGSVAWDLVYIPLRTAIFLAAVTFAFGLNLSAAGLIPATIVLIAFMPFVWGLGVAAAAILLTFKRGGGFIGLGFVALGLVSGVYFPLDLLPGWLAATAEANPVAHAIEAMRDSLLGDATLSSVLPVVLALIPCAAVSLAFGLGLFRLAVRRERRRGSMGLY